MMGKPFRDIDLEGIPTGKVRDRHNNVGWELLAPDGTTGQYAHPKCRNIISS